MKFVQAKWFHSGGNENVTRVVIHDAEYPEKMTGAEDIADYFARGAKKASAHYVCDADSTVQCVKGGDIAFHAPPNTGSIGIELCGYAKQTTEDWLDQYGIAMLKGQAAPLVATLCATLSVPVRWLTVEQLRAGWHGITSHNNVSLAFHQSTHTDPGGNFPVDVFMGWVEDAGTPPPVPQPAGDDDMATVFATNDPAEPGQVLETGSDLFKLDGESAHLLATDGAKTLHVSRAVFDKINAKAE